MQQHDEDIDNTAANDIMGATGDSNDSGCAGDQGDYDKTKLIVNYIPQFATEDDLAHIFATIGRVENIKIMRDFKTGYSFGFGFVKYFTADDAAKAIQIVNGMNYKNKRLKVSYSRPPGADMKASNLYITNLPKDVTEQDVHDLFCGYGEIVQKSLLKDKITGLPRGVAFVRFSKGEEAQAAIAALDGKTLDNAMFPLNVRVAEDHGRQKAQYLDKYWGVPAHNRGFLQAPFRGAVMPPPPFRKMTPPLVAERGGGRFQGGPSSGVRNMGAGDHYNMQNPFFC